MIYFQKGGNWTDGVYAGLFSLTDPRAYREIVAPVLFDIDELPERWVKILMGQTGWTPKLVFKDDLFVDDPPVKVSDAEKKRIVKWYKRHKKGVWIR